MSGIYIPGMEMPKDEAVALYIYPDGRVKLWRPQAAVSHEYGAIPVLPHGRLIDADALKSDGFHTLVCYTGKMPYEYTAMLIDDVPTIIQAEEGE